MDRALSMKFCKKFLWTRIPYSSLYDTSFLLPPDTQVKHSRRNSTFGHHPDGPLFGVMTRGDCGLVRKNESFRHEPYTSDFLFKGKGGG